MASYYASMFQIPFMHLHVRDWKNKKQKLRELFDLKISKSNNSYSPITDYHYKNKKGFEQFQNSEVQTIFKDELKKFKEVLFSNQLDISIDISSFWFQISSNGQYHDVHNHGPEGYSSVCFLDFDEKHHKPTNFIAPFNNCLTGATLTYEPKDVKEGSLIFFPSVINHYAPPNYSDVPRMILSFNLKVR